jgi:hypothetical protein
MERREQSLDHQHLQAIADVWHGGRLEEPHRHVSSEGGRRRDEGIVTQAMDTGLGSGEMGRMKVARATERPQLDVRIHPGPAELGADRLTCGLLLLMDPPAPLSLFAFVPRLAHLVTPVHRLLTG